MKSPKPPAVPTWLLERLGSGLDHAAIGRRNECTGVPHTRRRGLTTSVSSRAGRADRERLEKLIRDVIALPRGLGFPSSSVVPSFRRVRVARAV